MFAFLVPVFLDYGFHRPCLVLDALACLFVLDALAFVYVPDVLAIVFIPVALVSTTLSQMHLPRSVLDALASSMS